LAQVSPVVRQLTQVLPEHSPEQQFVPLAQDSPVVRQITQVLPEHSPEQHSLSSVHPVVPTARQQLLPSQPPGQQSAPGVASGTLLSGASGMLLSGASGMLLSGAASGMLLSGAESGMLLSAASGMLLSGAPSLPGGRSSLESRSTRSPPWICPSSSGAAASGNRA
jgi:hypothetical protein